MFFSGKLTVPDARLPGLECVVLHPVPGVADDFGVFPIFTVAVPLLLGAAQVLLVTGQIENGLVFLADQVSTSNCLTIFKKSSDFICVVSLRWQPIIYAKT